MIFENQTDIYTKCHVYLKKIVNGNVLLIWRSKAYLGMEIRSGIVSVPNPVYFMKDSKFHSTGISEIYTRDRLDKIGH